MVLGWSLGNIALILTNVILVVVGFKWMYDDPHFLPSLSSYLDRTFRTLTAGRKNANIAIAVMCIGAHMAFILTTTQDDQLLLHSLRGNAVLRVLYDLLQQHLVRWVVIFHQLVLAKVLYAAPYSRQAKWHSLAVLSIICGIIDSYICYSITVDAGQGTLAAAITGQAIFCLMKLMFFIGRITDLWSGNRGDVKTIDMDNSADVIWATRYFELADAIYIGVASWFLLSTLRTYVDTDVAGSLSIQPLLQRFSYIHMAAYISFLYIYSNIGHSSADGHAAYQTVVSPSLPPARNSAPASDSETVSTGAKYVDIG
jgi:hypothetical protein